MHFRTPSAIRFQLTRLMAVAVLPVWLVSGILVYHAYTAKRDQLNDAMLDTARSLVMVLDRDLASVQAALTALSTSPSFAAGDFASLHRQATQLLQSYPEADIILADATGQQLVNSYLPYGTPLPKRKNPETVRRIFATGKPVISDLFHGAVTRRPLIGIDVPVFIDGKVVYDLGMTFPSERFCTLLLQQNLPAGRYTTIVDTKKILVARSREPKRYVGSSVTPAMRGAMARAPEGTLELKNIEGTPVFATFCRSAMSGWSVVVGVPRASVMAGIYHWLGWAITGASVFSLFGIAFAVGYARRISGSIQSLVNPALAIGRGEPVLSVDAHDIKETGEVATALVQASDLLLARHGELRESERRYSALFANKMYGIAHCRVITDEQNRPVDYLILHVNDAYERIIGMKRADLEGRRATEAFPGVLNNSFDYVGVLGRLALEGGEIEVETHLEMTAQYLRIYAYSPLSGEFTAILTDVTRQRRMKEEHARLAAVVKCSDEAILSMDLDEVILQWNSGAERLFGYSAAEAVGKPITMLIPVDLRPEHHARQQLRRLLAGEKVDNFETVWLSNQGRRINVSVTVSAIKIDGRIVGASRIVRDITKQTQVEAYKEASREISQILIGTADLHDLLRQVLASLKSRTGFEAVGIRLQAMEDFPYFEQDGFSSDFLVTENELIAHTEYGGVCRDQDGRIRLECACGLVLSGKTDQRDPHRTPGGSFWTNDLSSLGDILPGRDPRFRPRNVCPEQGYASMVLVAIRNNDRILGLLQLNSRNKAQLNLETVEILEGIASQVAAALVRRQDEETRIKLEDELQHAQKMESVGRLAGGVAHDFNNMLGVIIGHANLALMDVAPTQPLHVNLLEIRKAAERSADLTRQLLAFARKQTITPKLVNLNETVAGMLKMLQRIIGEGIDLQWQPEEGAWPVKVDPSQLDQILANLCINARDAISDLGKITIETRNVTVDETYLLEFNGGAPGDYVRLTVSDNGCGMDTDTMALIFEPFFTTKGPGKGTGLGLATVYGAVKQNNGFIYTQSRQGLGTTISVFLPRSEGDTSPARIESATGPAARGHETILLVEDEPAILNIATMLLTRQGYTVLAADSPRAAIDLAREHDGEISLLLTDVVMPEMNGRELAKELLSRHHLLKRLFMSGFTADVIAHHGVIDEGVNFIQKPFSMHALASKVRDVLDAKD